MQRRQFLGAAIGAPTVLWGSEEPSRLELAGRREPGERLTVTGTVYAPDGRTTLAGVRLFVYHTDATGRYAQPKDDPRNARIHGWVRTDSLGRYELRTIKPGHYPNWRQASHIHVHVYARDWPEHWIPSYLFHGDPYLDQQALDDDQRLGKFGFILHSRRTPSGVIECACDIRLDRAVAERNRLINGWYR